MTAAPNRRRRRHDRPHRDDVGDLGLIYFQAWQESFALKQLSHLSDLVINWLAAPARSRCCCLSIDPIVQQPDVMMGHRPMAVQLILMRSDVKIVDAVTPIRTTITKALIHLNTIDHTPPTFS